LVRARRDGRRRLYQLEAKPIENIYRWAAAYKVFFDPEGHAWAFKEIKR